MRSQQVLQLLQSSGLLAATIGPRAGTASCISDLLRGIVASGNSVSVSAAQLRGLSAEALPTVNDQANTLLADEASKPHSPTSAAATSPPPPPPPAAAAAPAVSTQPAAATAAAAEAPTAAPSKQRKSNDVLIKGKEQLLKYGGLWVPKETYSAMSAEQQTQVHQQQQQFLWKMKQQRMLQQVTACNMLVQLSPNSQQLEVVVAATATADVIGRKRAAAIAAKAAAEEGSSSSSSKHPSRPYSSSSSDTAENISTQQQQQRSSGSDKQHGRQQQQQQQQHLLPLDRLTRIQQIEENSWRAGTAAGTGIATAAAAAGTTAADFGKEFVTSPRLDRKSLLKQNGEARIVNLNSQFTLLAAEPEGHEKIVDLFDELIAKGMQEAQQQQQQQREDDILVLPRQYCPDHQALSAYCRSLVWLGENQERVKRDFEASGRDGGWVRRCTIDQAERAAALWGRYDVSKSTPGLQVHLALMAAYRAGGRADKGVQLYYKLRDANKPSSLNIYRFHMMGLTAALQTKNFRAADEIARLFSSNVVLYRTDGYRLRLARCYRLLATGAAACGQWEKALYWLQELINNYTLSKVEPDIFFSVMMHAASAGRIDYVRMLLHAADEHTKVQDGTPVVYREDQLRLLIEAAGAAGDVDCVETLWQRLLHDLAPSNNTSSSSSSKSSSRPAVRPSAQAYKTVVRALVEREQWSKALDLAVEFDNAYGEAHSGPGRDFSAVSVFDGLSFFPLALSKESQVAAVFEAVKARKDSGQPVTTTLMNIVCRSIARLGNTEAAGQVFQSYGVWNIPHDADSYNAILECCEINSKVVGAESLISYMTSKGIKPNTSTWNLLTSTAIRAGDSGAVVSAIERTLAAGCKVREYLVKRAKMVAHQTHDAQLEATLNKVINLQNLSVPPVVLGSYQRWQQQQNGRGSADVWTPTRGSQQPALKQQQQQRGWRQQWRPGQQEEGEEDQRPGQRRDHHQQQFGKHFEEQQEQQQLAQQQDDNSSEVKPEGSGTRSQLRDAFGK